MLPKIHKVNIPGKPVISSVFSHTIEISRFTTKLSFTTKCNGAEKFYFKDTKDFINKITPQLKISTKSLLPLRSSYTNIPHKEGITALKESLDRKPVEVSIMVILIFVKLILRFNNLQSKGCAMGTKPAPCYANIFMGKFEVVFIYPKIEDSTVFM